MQLVGKCRKSRNSHPPGIEVKDLYRAGSVAAVIRQGIEAGHYDGTQKSVTGLTMGEWLSAPQFTTQRSSAHFSNPYTKEGGLFVLKGNLAPLGAVIKIGGVAPEMLVHKGPAKVFNSEAEGFPALTQGKIEHGDVMVIRYEGPKGGPGMQEMLALTFALISYGYNRDVALITDGRFSGASIGGVIGHVSPEAAEGGLIALVEDGDIIATMLWPAKSISKWKSLLSPPVVQSGFARHPRWPPAGWRGMPRWWVTPLPVRPSRQTGNEDNTKA